MAASTALPPAARMSLPALAASGLAAAIMSRAAAPLCFTDRPVGASGAGAVVCAEAAESAAGAAARNAAPMRWRQDNAEILIGVRSLPGRGISRSPWREPTNRFVIGATLDELNDSATHSCPGRPA